MKTKTPPKDERYPQQDPRQQRSGLWIGFILLISGWMFFLGVLVGRGTAPALFDYQRIDTEIAALAKSFKDSRKAQNETTTDILATQAGLEYPEELKKKTEAAETIQMPVPEKPEKTEKPEKPVKPAETPKPVQQEPAQAPTPPPAKSDFQAAAKPEPIEQPPDSIKTGPEIKIKSMYDIKASQARETVSAAPERTPPAAPKSPPPPASDNKTESTPQSLSIHLTSLVDKKSADALIQSLRSKGISASKAPRMLPGKGVWYTVVIGKYTSSAEADAMLNRLKQENVDASLVKQ
ncbi:MAG: SPOR domain-containing protein [Deltaproteobacteria bacterium]|nr:SPOR domain-containing protein [Deltaproteobacteria bacterium]